MTEKLQFKPLTEGLGFHPFSEGLPYTPAAKPASSPRTQSGVGAVAAGLPSFARTLPKATPVATPQVSAKALPKATTHSATRTAPRSMQPGPAAQPLQPVRPMAIEVVGEGSLVVLFKRIIAYALDSLLNISICAAALAMSLSNQGVRFDALYDWEIWFTGALFLLFFNWALIVGQEIAFRSTLAKRLFGLTMEGSPLAIFVRGLLFVPSALFCGIGLVWAFGDSRRRCWHDLATGAHPIEAR